MEGMAAGRGMGREKRKGWNEVEVERKTRLITGERPGRVRTQVEGRGARAQSGETKQIETPAPSTALGAGFYSKRPPPRSSALLIRLNVATDLTHRTRDSLISVAIISVMQRRATRNNKLLGKYNISLSIFLFDLHFEGNHLEDRYLFIDLYMCILFSKRSFLIFSRVYAYTRCSIHIVDIQNNISRKSFHARTRMRHVHCDQGRCMTHRRIITTLPVNPV